MPTKLVPYTDGAGVRHWVEVSASTALALASFDRNMRRREALYRKTIVTETDARATRQRGPSRGRVAPKLVGYLCVENEPAFRAVVRASPGNPWEGPRHSFTHLIGEGATWPPAGSSIDPETQGVWRKEGGYLICALCGGAKLERHQACLGCCRTGRDGEIGTK